MAFQTVEFWWLTIKLRWLGFRLRRRTGVNFNARHRRAELARRRAYDRALLIDPTDREAAERAGGQAFRDTF